MASQGTDFGFDPWFGKHFSYGIWLWPSRGLGRPKKVQKVPPGQKEMRSRGQIWLWDEKQMWVEGGWSWNPRILWPAILPNRRRKTSKICRYFDKMQTGLVAVVAAVMVDRQKGFISLFPLLPGVLVSIWMSKHPRSCYMRKIKQVLKKMLRNSINGLNGTKSLWFDLIQSPGWSRTNWWKTKLSVAWQKDN